MHDEQLYLLLLRGDHQLNEVKAAKLPGLKPLPLRHRKGNRGAIGCRPGSIGPVGMPADVTVIADRAVPP